MKWIFYLLYSALIFLPANVYAQAGTSSKTYAIVIGISKYEDAAIPPLQYADKDARLFAEYLQSKQGGKVPANQIRLLVNEQATIAAISNAFDWLRESCKQNDIAYVFFSGHGDVETKTIDSLGYLLAYNTPPNNYRNNAIRIADVNSDANTLSVLKKSKVILITDACHSGKLAGDAYGGRQLAARQLRLINENEVRLASCAPDEFSAEGSQWGGGRGVFSYYLINGLQGMADNAKDGKIELKEMEHYLDSCFANDKTLLQENHKQQPVIKGNPDFSLATFDNKMMLALSPAPMVLAKSLEAIKPAALTPYDSLFISLADVPIEGVINFEPFTDLLPDAIPQKFLDACINKYKVIDSFYKDVLRRKVGDNQLPSVASLKKISETVKKKNIAALFNTYLSSFIHTKAQKMINAYLKGDANEMSRREYYYTGNEKYSDFLSMHKLGFGLLSADNRLYSEMEMQQAYLSGLITRLQINYASNKDSLLKTAFQFQYKALALDEGAAYVHNEMGILFSEKKQFDSAEYHLRFATDMAPTWALPWNNLIALNLVTGDLKMAAVADSMAKKLQPETDVVLVNEGLLMERLNNLLVASAAYKKAIEINDRHYLPYACLGLINIKTGNYALADSFLYEASMKLEGLGVASLAQEMEYASNVPRNMKSPKSIEDYIDTTNLKAGKKIPVQYDQLYKGLLQYKAGNFADAEILLANAVKISANIPLANHYLGLALIKQSKWKEAELPFKAAIKTFQTKDSLWSTIAAAIEVSSALDSNNLVRASIFEYKYEAPEDYFLLAKQYEKRGLNETAVATYRSLMAVQKFKGDFLLPYIKAGRLLDEMGDFVQEEKLLLDEFELMKQLADPETITSRDFAIIKSELYRFYESRIKQFPNQPEWYKKAGLFIFQQLEPIFKYYGSQYYNSLYKGFSVNTYPLLQNTEFAGVRVLEIPGTEEELEFIYPDVNAVTQSLEYLQKTLQLWGVAEKPFDAVFAVAQLNSWMNNKNEATKWFQEAVDIQPKNSVARNTYIQYLTFIDELPTAYEQLEILNDQNHAATNQQLVLANYRMLSGKYKGSEELLHKCGISNEVDKEQVMKSYATLWYLSGNTKKGLQYLSDSVKAGTGKDECFRLYSIARYTAIAGDAKKGFALLKVAFDKGFKRYRYVLENDKAWASIRQTKEWETLIKQAEYAYYHNYSAQNNIDFFDLIRSYWY